jgi:predicted aspartyl protease
MGLAKLLLAIAAAASCTVQMPAQMSSPSEVAPGEVAFELASGESAIVVPVRIDGQGPFRFILDTGATLTCLDAATAKKLGLEQRAGVIGRGIGVRSEGGVGMVAITRLEVGSASAENLTACTLDLQSLRSAGVDVDGLLGLNFLREYRMTLDFERRALKLENP